MALGIKSNFSIGNVIDPTTGAQRALSQVGSIMSMRQEAADKEADRKMKEQVMLQQQANSERMYGLRRDAEDRQQSKYDRSVTKDNKSERDSNIAAAILSDIPQTGSTSKTVTTPGNQVSRDEIIAANAAREAKLADINNTMVGQSEKFTDLYNKYNVPSPATPNISMLPGERNSNEVVLKEYPRVPGESKRTYYETVDGNKIGAVQKFFGGYNEVKDFSGNTPEDRILHNANPIAPLVTSTGELVVDPSISDKAFKKAMEESGLNTSVANINTVPVKQDVDDLVGDKTKTIVTNSTLSNAEKRDKYDEAVISSNMGYKAKVEALKNGKVIFPEDKALTPAAMLSMLKYKDKRTTDATTVAGYRTMYPTMPKDITTVAGAKGYAKKYDKSSSAGNSFNLAESMYKNLSTKGDAENVAAIDAFLLTEEGKKVSSMSIPDQKAWMAKKSAQYAEESGSWDISDYIPFLRKSPASNILSK